MIVLLKRWHIIEFWPDRLASKSNCSRIKISTILIKHADIHRIFVIVNWIHRHRSAVITQGSLSMFIRKWFYIIVDLYLHPSCLREIIEGDSPNSRKDNHSSSIHSYIWLKCPYSMNRASTNKIILQDLRMITILYILIHIIREGIKICTVQTSNTCRITTKMIL